ncbi:MAG TPA: hypothetical protein PK544_03700 [Spirochaetota bacterium]|mgnify:FL=1|nr:hypothetical protein [Spirochaetota bacterium]HPJ36994.1 hypothetical protein [Spirochaetota bacterium]HPQ52632.1 hypothetical protein [Spirochaetota bacterium]
MEVFDGFIAAIAAEFKINFHKDDEGVYTTNLEFDNGRSQQVLITLTKDETGDRVINYYTIVAKLKDDYFDLYKYALQLNTTLIYGALSLLNSTLIIRDTLLLRDCDPQRFMKSLTYIAAKGDELEELFISKNIY